MKWEGRSGKKERRWVAASPSANFFITGIVRCAKRKIGKGDVRLPMRPALMSQIISFPCSERTLSEGDGYTYT